MKDKNLCCFSSFCFVQCKILLWNGRPLNNSHYTQTEVSMCVRTYYKQVIKVTLFFLYCIGPPFATKAALTCGDMDSTRWMKVFCCIWHQVVSSRSFESCKLRGGASFDQTCLSSTSNKCLNWTGLKFSQQNIAQIITLPPQACFLSIMHPGVICR